MTRYRKKPVIIDAVQYVRNGTGDLAPLVPDWLRAAIERGDLYFLLDDVRIKTLEGTLTVSPGDWIVRGVQGEIYPVKPDIFEATYEREQVDD